MRHLRPVQTGALSLLGSHTHTHSHTHTTHTHTHSHTHTTHTHSHTHTTHTHTHKHTHTHTLTHTSYLTSSTSLVTLRRRRTIKDAHSLLPGRHFFFNHYNLMQQSKWVSCSWRINRASSEQNQCVAVCSLNDFKLCTWCHIIVSCVHLKRIKAGWRETGKIKRAIWLWWYLKYINLDVEQIPPPPPPRRLTRRHVFTSLIAEAKRSYDNNILTISRESLTISSLTFYLISGKWIMLKIWITNRVVQREDGWRRFTSIILMY